MKNILFGFESRRSNSTVTLLLEFLFVHSLSDRGYLPFFLQADLGFLEAFPCLQRFQSSQRVLFQHLFMREWLLRFHRWDLKVSLHDFTHPCGFALVFLRFHWWYPCWWLPLDHFLVGDTRMWMIACFSSLSKKWTPLANCFPLSEMMMWGTPKRQMMCSHTNFSICLRVTETKGLASTHLVK